VSTRRWVAGALVAAFAVFAAACSAGGGSKAPAPGPATVVQAAVPTTAVPTTLAPTTSTLPGAVPVAALASVPADAATMASALASTEGTIHDAATPLASVPGIGATEQRLVATVASHPDWVGPVLAALPAPLRAGVSSAITGDRELSSIPGPTPTAIPSWTIVAPLPADQLLADYQKTQAATGVAWTILAAINLVETRMGRIVVPASAIAQGPMQFLAGTWAAYGGGGDIHDPGDAIAAAGRLLQANGAARDLTTALHHYNTSPHYARGVQAFAAAMAADIRAFYAFYGWRVYVNTTVGTFLLPERFSQAA
jgi:hypothetical protein